MGSGSATGPFERRMNRQRRRVSKSISIVIVGVFAVLAMGTTVASLFATDARAVHAEEDRFRCDGGYCADGRHRVLDCRAGWCAGPSVAFPTIVRPFFDDGAWLDDEDRVLGLLINGDARAYPVKVVTYFETVNDTVGGEPVLVSYCPLCGSGIVYSRIVDGQELVFLNTGAIWRNDLVIYDLQTESWWTQIGGDALTGPMHGILLDLVDSQHVTWKEWKSAHPGTKVLARPVDEAGNNLAPYHREHAQTDLARSLTSYSRVHGVHLGSTTVAFPVFQVREQGVVHVTIDEVRYVIGYAAEEAHVYDAEGRTFIADEENASIVDESGVRYDVLTGKGDDGSRLERIPGRTTYWFAWRDFHKDTLVYDPDEDLVEDASDGLALDDSGDLVPADDVAGLPTVSVALAVAVAVSLAAALRFGRRS